MDVYGFISLPKVIGLNPHVGFLQQGQSRGLEGRR